MNNGIGFWREGNRLMLKMRSGGRETALSLTDEEAISVALALMGAVANGPRGTELMCPAWHELFAGRAGEGGIK
jgi:hypothetical protein